MTFQIRIVAIADNGQEQMHEIACLQRSELTPDTLGLTLAEGKGILTEIQRVVVEHQTTDYVAGQRRCSACGQVRRIQGQRVLP